MRKLLFILLTIVALTGKAQNMMGRSKDYVLGALNNNNEARNVSQGNGDMGEYVSCTKDGAFYMYVFNKDMICDIYSIANTYDKLNLTVKVLNQEMLKVDSTTWHDYSLSTPVVIRLVRYEKMFHLYFTLKSME